MKSLTRLWALLLIAMYGATLALPAVALAATAPFPTCTLSIVPSVIEPGGSATITWTSANATAGAITYVGNVGPNGSKQILPPPGQITTYVGSFNGPGGTANCTASVQVSYGTVTGASTDVVVPNPVPTSGSTVNTPVGAQQQLVQCGLGTGIAATDCQACNLAQLVSSIINFLIGLSIPIAAFLFAWAGILYFTSGANPGNIEKAKAIFSNALIGFLIAITAWLVINTLLHALLDGGKVFTQGTSWFTIQCSDQSARPVNVKVNTVINSVLPGVNTSNPTNNNGLAVGDFNDRFGSTDSSGGATPVCSSGSTYVSGSCYNATTDTVSDPTYTYSNTAGNSGAGTAQWASQLAQACSNSGLSDTNCTFAQAVMANESDGRSGVISKANCVGLMQMCPSTACDLNPTIDGCSTRNYAAVTQALLDPGTNMSLGTQLLSKLDQSCNGDPSCMAAAYNGGLGATKTSNTCAGQAVWQCTANSGYTETRNYVPKVLSTFNNLKK